MRSNYGKDLYRQFEECVARMEKLEKKLTEQQLAHEREIERLHTAYREKIEELKTENAALKQAVAEKDAKIEKLTAEVERLKSIINNDSDNSSNPPSTDQKGGKNANEYNGRTKSGKRPGGQKGHKGKALTEADVQKLLESGECEHRLIGIGKESRHYVTRYVVDIKTVPVVTEIRIYRNENGKYVIPEQYRTIATYGNNIKSMALLLYSVGVVANNRICSFINSITDGKIKLAAGTVYGFCRSFADFAEKKLREYKEALLNEKVLYTDATNINVSGKQQYIRNISSDDTVIFEPMTTKSYKSLDKIGLLTAFQGIFVHDHETALYKYGQGHAECNVHILRYLLKNTQDTDHAWSGTMTSLLLEMKTAIEYVAPEQLPQDVVVDFENRYDMVIQQGWTENVNNKFEWARDKEEALLKRLTDFKANHLLFLHRLDVAFSNNMSERDLRQVKTRQKMAGGFRSEDGCRMFCNILSFVITAKRRGILPYSGIRELLGAGEQ